MTDLTCTPISRELRELTDAATFAEETEMGPIDVLVLPYEFSATKATVVAMTPRGRELFADSFGPGAAHVEMPVSRTGDFLLRCSRQGLRTA